MKEYQPHEERLIKEEKELWERIIKLRAMLEKWEGFDFEPSCTKEQLQAQEKAMTEYINAIWARNDYQALTSKTILYKADEDRFLGFDSIIEMEEYVKANKTIKTSVTQEQISSLMDSAIFEDQKMGDAMTVVLAKFPSGWMELESSACVDPNNYDHDLGIEICKNRIADKLWKLEGYLLMDKINQGKGELQ